MSEPLFTRKKLFALLLASVAVVFVMWFFGTRGHNPAPNNGAPSDRSSENPSSDSVDSAQSGATADTDSFTYRGNPPTLPLNPSNVTGPSASLSAHAVEEIRRCAGGDGLGAAVGGSLDQLLPSVQNRANQEGGPNASPLQAEKQYENYHVVLSTGEERRIQITTDISADGSTLERLRLYSVDEEGLPVPLPQPGDGGGDSEPDLEAAVDADRGTEELNPSPESVRALINQGKLVFSESSWIASRSSGERPGRVAWKVTNGRVSELQWIGTDANLGCAVTDLSGRAERPEVDCDCRK